MFEIPAPLASNAIKKIDDAALVRPNLFQISNREGFRGCAQRFIAVAPDCVEIIVFGKSFQQFRRAAGNYIDDAPGKVAGFKHLIQITSDQRIFFRRNSNDRIAGGDERKR